MSLKKQSTKQKPLTQKHHAKTTNKKPTKNCRFHFYWKLLSYDSMILQFKLDV